MTPETLSTFINIVLYVVVVLGLFAVLSDKIRSHVLHLVVVAILSYPVYLLAHAALFIALAVVIGVGSYSLIKDHIENIWLRLLATGAVSVAMFILLKLLFAFIAWILPVVLIVAGIVFLFSIVRKK